MARQCWYTLCRIRARSVRLGSMCRRGSGWPSAIDPGCRHLCHYHSQQSNEVWEAGRQFSSKRLSSWCWFKLYESDLRYLSIVQLGNNFFDHSQLNPICTIRHKISYIKIRYDYIKPLYKIVTPSIKMDYIDWPKKEAYNKVLEVDLVWSPTTQRVQSSTGSYLLSSQPSVLLKGFTSFLWRNNPMCLTFQVPLVQWF